MVLHDVKTENLISLNCENSYKVSATRGIGGGQSPSEGAGGERSSLHYSLGDKSKA